MDAAMADGYTVTINLNALGWAITTSGLTTDITDSGAWAGTFDFSDLQTNLHATAMIQKRNVAGTQFLNVGSISVDVVPEPSSAALLGLGGLALILRRRK